MADQRSRSARAQRVYLDVPYSERQPAKQAGARWDPAERRWYDPRPRTPALQRWAARPDVPELLPGEDRNFGQGLFVDLVPSSCWFTNVRSCVAEIDWERLRRPVLRRAHYRCEACSAAEDRAGGRRLEVHERWHYDDDRNVQRLRLIALCTACHSTTHIGYAKITGREREALAHLQSVTGMSDDQARRHVTTAYAVWTARSAIEWELDLSILTGAGIQLRRRPTATERVDRAKDQLAGVDTDQTTTPTDNDGLDTQETPDRTVENPPPAEMATPPGTDEELARLLAGPGWHGGPDDLARNAAGIGVTHEATRRRQLEGVGADLSWRVGADGEAAVAEILAKLTTPSWKDRLRRSAPDWRVLHSVPVGTGRGDIDHVLIGPPGVVTVNTKHHRVGRLSLDGDELIVNGHRTDYIPKARREAERAASLLTAALTTAGQQELAGQLRVRSVIAVVAGRVLINQWADGVAVVMTRQLLHSLTSMPAAFTGEQVDQMYAVARHRGVWARQLP